MYKVEVELVPVVQSWQQDSMHACLLNYFALYIFLQWHFLIMLRTAWQQIIVSNRYSKGTVE